MKLTNKFNHPEEIVRAIANDPYDRGDSEFSATSLIQPARISALTEIHKDEIVTDADDELFKLYGQLGHSILERAAGKKSITEKRFFFEVDGVKLSTQIDSLSLENEMLTDWKFTTVYGFMKGSPPKPEWVRQLNIQLYALREHGLDAKKLRIVGLLRDWRPKEAELNPRYPKKVAAHDIPIFSREETQEYIRDRIHAHRDAREKLPNCTYDEHWAWRRCKGYCSVAPFCSQYKNKEKKDAVPHNK